MLLLLSTACCGQELQQQVRQLMSTKYRDAAAKAEKFAQERRFGDGHKLWLSAVPDDDKIAADYFLLGNVLFGALPEKSLELHQRAAKLMPANADIQLEVAMCLHKCGRFEEAAAAYGAYVESPAAKSRGPGVMHALLADCLVRTGKYAAACDAWEQVPFRSYRIKIAHYAHNIHGKVSPFQRHYELLARARTKDVDAAMNLILLDCEWDWNWWNTEVKRDFLKADTAELGTLFPKEDSRLALARAISAYHLPERSDISVFAGTLKSNNLIIGDKPAMPHHGLLVSHATRLILENKLATPEKLLQVHKDRFETELLKPADQINIEIVNVYASLLAQAKRDTELTRVDRLMWRKTNEPRFAISYLASLVRDGKGLDDDEVKRILKQFSDHRVVSSVALSLAMEDKRPLTKPLAVAIAAEFKSLTPNRLTGTRTADRLNALFKELRQSLSK